MQAVNTFSYARYLAAKETLDERSLNRNVWDTFVNTLTTRDSEALNIIEVGCGIGTTFKRIASARLKQDLNYTLLDIEDENLNYFKLHVDHWLRKLGYERQSGHTQKWSNSNGHCIAVDLVLADVQQFIEDQKSTGLWDIIVAQAFLDLFNIETFLPRLLRLLKSHGVFYFPINFDGITSFLPIIDPATDLLVESIYHKSMDARTKEPALKGCSQSGRYLLAELLKQNLNVSAVGSSDWIVYPKQSGYSGDEQYFLHQIMEFVNQELEKSNDIEPDVARDWILKRKNQIRNGELFYLAHQIDILGELG